MDPQRTHFNKRCTRVTHSPANPERLLVHFQDGTTHETDIVLGADGIKSVVRDFVTGAGTGAPQSVVYSGQVAYRGLIPAPVLKAAGFKTQLANRPLCFLGPDKVRESGPWSARRTLSRFCA